MPKKLEKKINKIDREIFFTEKLLGETRNVGTITFLEGYIKGLKYLKNNL